MISETPRLFDSNPLVSAVMPCLNEARTLAVCIAKAQTAFADMGVSGEVVIGDNGSTDGSQELARSLGARVIDIPRRGYGAALMGGIEAARGSVIVIGDSDDSYDWTAIAPFVEEIRRGADLVMGNRFRGGIRPGAMSASHRYLGNPVLSFIAKIAFRAPIGDFHSGMRAFTPEAYRRMHLRTPGMEFATEMVANAMRAGLRIAEVPIVLYPDGRDRPPHLNTVRDGWRHLRFIVTYAPDHLFIIPSVIALVLGLALITLLAAGPVVIGGVNLGIHYLALGSLLALSGLSFLMFGLIAKLTLRRVHPDMPSRLVDWLLDDFKLEVGLLIGVISAGIGLLALGFIAVGWIHGGGGPSENTVHPAFAAMTLVVLGIWLCFGSFLLHLFAEENDRQ